MSDWLLVALGLLLLLGGGEGLVRGASGIALAARLPPTVVGLTIVSAGTSMPELVVSVQSALAKSPALAVGNVVGSNIFNIAAILGVTAVVQPLKSPSATVKKEGVLMVGAVVLLAVLSFDSLISRVEGIFLFFGLVAFVTLAVWQGRKLEATTPLETPEDLATADFGKTGGLGLALNLGATVVGVGFLAVGASTLVQGAQSIAQAAGISEAIIGLTVVAAGTSMPELITSLVAALRGRDDIAVANVLGSNLFNVLGIAGMTAIIYPLQVAPEIISRDNVWMCALSLALLPIMWTGQRISRGEGAALLTAFLVYLGLLISGATG